MRRIWLLVLASAALLAMGAVAVGAATTGTTYAVDQATATPRFQCTDSGCGALISYTYTGQGTCTGGCVGWPTDPVDVTLTFTVNRTLPPNPCKMKTGTGTLDAQYPSDPVLPSAQGTFSFKAVDGKTVKYSGHITSSTVSVLDVGATLDGFVTFPPSPCDGGVGTAGVTFAG